jgi:hypothetical protein
VFLMMIVVRVVVRLGLQGFGMFSGGGFVPDLEEIGHFSEHEQLDDEDQNDQVDVSERHQSLYTHTRTHTQDEEKVGKSRESFFFSSFPSVCFCQSLLMRKEYEGLTDETGDHDQAPKDSREHRLPFLARSMVGAELADLGRVGRGFGRGGVGFGEKQMVGLVCGSGSR